MLKHTNGTWYYLTPHANWRGEWSYGTLGNGNVCTTAASECPGWPGFQQSMDGWAKGSIPPAYTVWWGDLLRQGSDATRLQYRRNRYYDPQTGRFTQHDPIGLAGGLNLYGFAAGDPVNFSDPFGLSPTCLAGALGGVALGAGLSVATGSGYGVGSLLLDAGLGCIGAGLGSKLAKLRSLRSLVVADDAAAAARRADPNRLHHLFGQAKHNLDDFAGRFRSQDEAFFAIQDATQAAFDAGKITANSRGLFSQTVRVAGQELIVEGRVVDGVIRIGTAYR